MLQEITQEQILINIIKELENKIKLLDIKIKNIDIMINILQEE